MIICKGNVNFLNVWLEIMMRVRPRTVGSDGAVDAFSKEFSLISCDVVTLHGDDVFLHLLNFQDG